MARPPVFRMPPGRQLQQPLPVGLRIYGLRLHEPADEAHVAFGRRNVEGGPRYDDLGHTSFPHVAGVKGDINDAWSYDAYAQNGITRLSESTSTTSPSPA